LTLLEINEARLAELYNAAYLPFIEQNHGASGGVAARAIMQMLKDLYAHREPTSFGRLILFQTVSEVPMFEARVEHTSVVELARLDDPVMAVQLTGSGRLRVLTEIPDVLTVSDYAVVYVYGDDGEEYFWARGQNRTVTRLHPALQSAFATPTFTSLDDALNYYARHVARVSRCHVLDPKTGGSTRGAWYDPKRLFFLAKPETTIRRSLEQFLVASLRGSADVRPEQIVDESHPVDLKVTFDSPRHVALVEIKWLGKSRNEDGSMATEYSQSRAQEGANQLADYLEANYPYDPEKKTRGYLVVLDARRWSLNEDSTSVTSQNGMYYANREIAYDPDHHASRRDFAPPLRMFVEPVCQ
jgi:hypothetical protein